MDAELNEDVKEGIFNGGLLPLRTKVLFYCVFKRCFKTQDGDG